MLKARGVLATALAAGIALSACAGTGGEAVSEVSPGLSADVAPERRTPLPVPRSLTLNAVGNLLDWNRTPPGVNPDTCKPAPGQRPVLMVHGTFANMMLAFSALGPALHNAGICAYAYNYGGHAADSWVHGLVSMEESAKRLAHEVERVRRITGADKVNLVGHSQGGTLIHYYAKVLGGADKVDVMVAVAPSLRGTERVSGKGEYTYCVACGQQSPDSAVIRRLNDGPISQPGNRNYVIATSVDWVVRPVEKQFIREPGVTNVLLQDLYPWRWATHSGLLYDSDAVGMMVKWLGGSVESTAGLGKAAKAAGLGGPGTAESQVSQPPGGDVATADKKPL